MATRFSDLKPGDVFRFRDLQERDELLKTDGNAELDECNAVYVKRGMSATIEPSEPVVRVCTGEHLLR